MMADMTSSGTSSGFGERNYVMRLGLFSVFGLIVIVLAAWVVMRAADNDPKVSPSPPPSIELSTPPNAPSADATASCPAGTPTPGPDEELVFFWCGSDLVPLVRRIGNADSRRAALLAAFIAGPTPEEFSRGIEGGLYDPAIRGTVTVTAGKAMIDFDPGSLDVERFNAGANFAIKALEATFQALPAVSSVDITIGGRPLCDLDPECGGEAAE